MIGIIINACSIVVGAVAGAVLHRGIKERYKTILYNGLGLSSIAIGLNATVTNLPKSEYPVMFIIAMSAGGVIGTWLDIDGRFHRLVNRRQARGKANNNTATGETATTGQRGNFADGLGTSILLYCIGPLSMLGPVISALQGDNTFLYTNSTLDLVTAVVFASTYGIGMALAAPVLFCWQGLFYLIAIVSSSAISDALMAELLIVGGLMITASGLSLLKLKDCHALNFLPALLVPVVFFIIKALM